jgi:amidase
LRKQAGDEPKTLRVFEAALADLRRAGAVLVDIDYDFPRAMGDGESEVLHHELREDLGAYLRGLPGAPAVRSLADLIAFNTAHPAELAFFGQETFDKSELATDVSAYNAARATSLTLAGTAGIDRLLGSNHVLFLIAPTEGPAWPIDHVMGERGLSGVGAGSLAAVAGYPHLTVPMGAVEGLPIGLSFIGSKWSDAAVLRAGAAYERARTARLAVPTLKRWNE